MFDYYENDSFSVTIYILTENKHDNFLHSKYYNEFLKQYGFDFITTLIFNKNTDGIAIFKKNSNFEPQELEVLTAITDIIANAYTSYCTKNSLSLQNSLMGVTLARTPYGIMIFDDQLNFQFANHTFFEMILPIYNIKDETLVINNIIENFHLLLNRPFSEGFRHSEVLGRCLLTIEKSPIDGSQKIYSILHLIDIELGVKHYFKHAVIQYKLTKREQEVISLLASGMTNIEIAEKLFLSTSSVKSHISNIFQKMEVSCRSEAISKISPMWKNFE